MKVTGRVNTEFLVRYTAKAQDTLVKTADAIRTNLVKSQTMPFSTTIKTTETVYGKKGRYKPDGSEYRGKKVTKVVHQGGNLQNNSTFVDDSKKRQNKVKIVSDTPYARRLYFHPEYNFNKTENPNAGGMWFHPYISGDKKDFASKTFKRLMKRSK